MKILQMLWRVSWSRWAWVLSYETGREGCGIASQLRGTAYRSMMLRAIDFDQTDCELRAPNGAWGVEDASKGREGRRLTLRTKVVR